MKFVLSLLQGFLRAMSLRHLDTMPRLDSSTRNKNRYPLKSA
ncbi:MAG: hypothetical protein H6R13_3191 [Proteobacteria bacterium]|nr:hypothetical protein [Pseudomonadota bacterium]